MINSDNCNRIMDLHKNNNVTEQDYKLSFEKASLVGSSFGPCGLDRTHCPTRNVNEPRCSDAIQSSTRNKPCSILQLAKRTKFKHGRLRLVNLTCPA